MDEQRASEDDDVDVDHYFLPGGILDTLSQREEDMIGGSLLDEIGGVGNVLLPSTQSKVSRIVGSGDPQAAVEVCEVHVKDLEKRSRQPSPSVGEGLPIRLSVEGTNPMAKEFTPSMDLLALDVAIEAKSGLGAPPSSNQRHISDMPWPTRAFSTAVGSEVKNGVTEQPCHRTLQRQPRKLARQIPTALPLQRPSQGVLGGQGQDQRHQPGWAARVTSGQSPARSSMATRATHSSSLVSVKHRLPTVNHGHQALPPRLAPPVGLQQRGNQDQLQRQAVVPGQWHRRECGIPGTYDGGKSGQHMGTTEDFSDRTPQPKAGPPSDHLAQTQRKHRSQGSVRQLQPGEHGGGHSLPVAKSGSLVAASVRYGRTYEGIGRDQGRVSSKVLLRSSEGEQDAASRRSHANNNNGQHPISKVPSRRGELVQDVAQSGHDSNSGSTGENDADTSVSHWCPTESEGTDHRSTPSQPPRGRLATGRQPVDRNSETVSTEGESTLVIDAYLDLSPVRWSGHTVERGAHQVKSEDDAIGLPQSHAHKDRDRTRSRKKEEKTYKPAPKQLLEASTKESNRARFGTRLNIWQRWGELRASILGVARGVLTAIVRAFAYCLSRLHIFRRLLALMSFAASSTVAMLSMVITTASWLLLMGLRVHSLALKEATGSIHVAVCFLFPYFFQYFVSMVDQWAPHWLPACLWYSFLMQMSCTSNHLCQHSIPSHLVPALRALLPVAFLCEVPSGRSYLLALGGSELLLLSFTLAAIRLRCLFSPVFLLSWCAQVFAIATFGSSSGLQYCQLLISLASLHTVSMVDIMLNSRFYHARYRAGMSLTSGFRAISPPAHEMQ